VFCLELTHDLNGLLPLLIAVSVAHMSTVLTLSRSILTEKVARRGYHLSQEYAVDPLEILAAREVMHTNVVALPAALPLAELAGSLNTDDGRRQRLYPLVGGDGGVTGVVTRTDIEAALARGATAPTLQEIAHATPVFVHPDDPLRVVAARMAETGRTLLPVMDGNGTRQLRGLVSLESLLQARARNLEAEQRRERVQHWRLWIPFGSRRTDRDESRAASQ